MASKKKTIIKRAAKAAPTTTSTKSDTAKKRWSLGDLATEILIGAETAVDRLVVEKKLKRAHLKELEAKYGDRIKGKLEELRSRHDSLSGSGGGSVGAVAYKWGDQTDLKVRGPDDKQKSSPWLPRISLAPLFPDWKEGWHKGTTVHVHYDEDNQAVIISRNPANERP